MPKIINEFASVKQELDRPSSEACVRGILNDDSFRSLGRATFNDKAITGAPPHVAIIHDELVLGRAQGVLVLGEGLIA